ncbi:hypothetical protein PS627_00088 [Pseudomonas fluorescens]|uniref:hypothetical protein n=1 Tax=Pseudomonas fluorescens TaxID=294 RepID=UPI00125228CB|nr:hypothetical protein [Pseudomonas fluorescens]CAG8863152.1 hypothetical protein PS627_00088 [Pseudomonas fluorescens]
MKDQGQQLLEEMQQIECPEGVVRAMNELAYTASEAGVIEFAFRDNKDIRALWQLFKLSEKYQGAVPDRLRM